jgi:hypothetical protein
MFSRPSNNLIAGGLSKLQLRGGTDKEKEPDSSDLVFLTCVIPSVCHNVYLVYYICCELVREQLLNITPAFLTSNVLSTLWQVDHVSSQVSKAELRHIDYGVWHNS